MHVYMHAMYARMYVCNVYGYVCMDICNACMCVSKYVCVYILLYVCNVCMCACVYLHWGGV